MNSFKLIASLFVVAVASVNAAPAGCHKPGYGLCCRNPTTGATQTAVGGKCPAGWVKY